MIYNDGFKMNKDDQVLICPKCKNEEFSPKSEFCRICGTRLYNKCEGEWSDYNQELYQHNSPGNARFCEICGKPTYFFTENFLKPWDKVQVLESDDNYFSTDEVAATSDEFDTSGINTDDDDLPF